MIRYTAPLPKIAPLIPEFASLLPAINQALRNVNLGKMDYLPYFYEIAGYTVSMTAILTPEGENRPPAVGHWQLFITPANRPYQVVLSGKASRVGGERGEVVFWCPDTPEETAWASDAEVERQD